jgi:xanthine dehydrogenase YagR molybdenum-binding subunit
MRRWCLRASRAAASRGIDTAAAQRVRGVRAVLTHENVGAFDSGGFLMGGGFGFQSFYPLRSAQVAYRGQSVAMVVADTLEAAREAAALVAVAYEAMAFVATLDAPDAEPLAQTAVLPQPMFADRRVGDPEGALAGAAVTVDLRYTLPAQHQNPMEIIATVAEWDSDGVLTIHEPTQNAEGVRHGVAKQLGIDAARVRVLSPTLGGGFGQKNSLQSHTALVAIAARTLGRPVKLVMTRAQLFHNASFRPASRHRVRLGADRHGRLVAAIHEIDQQTSRHDLFPSFGTEITSRLYGIGNYQGRERLVRTDVQTPGYMRAPFEHPRPSPSRARSTRWPMRSTATRWPSGSPTTPRPIRSPASRSPRAMWPSAWSRAARPSAGRAARWRRARCARPTAAWSAGAWPSAPTRRPWRRPSRPCACAPTARCAWRSAGTRWGRACARPSR